MMPAKLPSPHTTLIILLGASRWPSAPEFHASKAFLNVAMDLRAYFLNPSTFGLPPENFLNLFNSQQSPDDIDSEIGQFLEKRSQEMKQAGEAARDLIVYFIGHGGFVGNESDFYLAIRRTRAGNPGASSIRMTSLSLTLKEKARYLRRIIILDCCFAGAAFRAFQSAGPAQVAITKTIDAFEVLGKGVGLPGRGTSLLCSSRHNTPSLISQDGQYTLFSKAFSNALSIGNPHRQDNLSLRDLAELVEDALRTMPEQNAPRPEVHSPDQSEGDVANVPFFPNPCAEQERARRAGEERRRLDEEAERIRRMEEEKQRRVEVDTSPGVPIMPTEPIMPSTNGGPQLSTSRGPRLGLRFWIIPAIIISLMGGAVAFDLAFTRSFGTPDFNRTVQFQSNTPIVELAHNFRVTGTPTVVINGDGGTITVQTSPDATSVIVQDTKNPGTFGNANNLQVNYNQQGNTITTNVQGGGQGSVNFTVTVPQGADLQLSTNSGDIAVNGVTLSDNSTITTDSGNISFNGTIGTSGTEQFTTSSGTIDLTVPANSAFHLNASTNSGSINIGNFPGVTVNQGGTRAIGNVGTVSQAQGATVTLNTDSGDINVHQGP